MPRNKEFEVNRLYNRIVECWTPADFEQTPEDKLRYHISEFLDENGLEVMRDMNYAKSQFEEYVGW